MRDLTTNGGDLASYYDENDETEISNTYLKQTLINIHNVDANKQKTKKQNLIGHFFGFCKTFKKITK